jgi:aliphatic nitrilase
MTARSPEVPEEAARRIDQESSVRLAAVQAAPVWLNRSATVDKAIELISEAAAHGARFVGFPENFIPGHPVWYYYHAATSGASMELAVRLFENSVEIPGDDVDRLRQAAADNHTYVVMGLTERKPNTTGTLFNTQLFLGPNGEILGKHQKLVPTVGERLVHAPGSADAIPVVSTDLGVVSGLCCGENANPFALSLLAATYPWIHVASWPNHAIPGATNQPGSIREISALVSRSVAYIAKCYVISACATNGADMIDSIARDDADRAFMTDPAMSGGSVIVDPRGEIIAGPAEGETILLAEGSMEAVLAAKSAVDAGGHYSRPDLLSLTISRGSLEASAQDRGQPDSALRSPSGKNECDALGIRP